MKRQLPPPGRRPAGMTLIELMVVVAIMGLLMTIGAGVWLSFRRSAIQRRAYRSLAASCRRTRVFAVEESSPSRLILDRKNGSFHAEGLRLVGQWHLEGYPPDRLAPLRHGQAPIDPDRGDSTGAAPPPELDITMGFAGRNLMNNGGQLTVRGRRGTAIFLEGGASLTLDDPVFRFPAGGQFTCYLYPHRAGGPENILSRGRELSLGVNVGGELEARVGSALVTTTGYRLPAYRWSQVSFYFGPDAVSIDVDGVRRTPPDSLGDEVSERERGLPLDVGGGEHGFVGWVDEITLRRAVREKTFVLEGEMGLEASVEEIRFDPSGMLDRRYHSGPVRIGISHPDPDAPAKKLVRWITVTITGEIREE